MKVIYAIRRQNGTWRFLARYHDARPPRYSRLIGRVDNEDTRLMLEWCKKMQRKGWTIHEIEEGFK